MHRTTDAALRRPRAAARPRTAAVSAATAGALALLSALAGCTGGPAPSEADHAPAAVDIAAASRSAVRDGGTLRWAVDAVPATLNTYQSAADPQTSQIASAVLPALFTVDGRGRPRRNDDYLESAEVVRRAPQVVRYRLNPSARWSDGRAIGADDFVAQWKALSGENPAYWSAHNDGYDRIASVERGRDDREVQVTFTRPFAAWQSLFTPLYPKSVTGSPDAFNGGARGRLAATAGPFRLGRVDPRDGTVTLRRDPHWWGAPAKLDAIVLTAVPRAQRPAALADGSVDLAEVDSAALPQIPKGHGLVVRKAPEAGYTQLTLNGGSGPLADERVRRAIARAIDRQALADLVLRPAGLPARPLGNHLVMASQYGYRDNSSAVGRTDPKTAQAMLGDAGWRPGKASATTTAAAAAPAPGRPAPPHRAPSATAPAASDTPDEDVEAPDDASASPSASVLAQREAVVEPAAQLADRTGHPLALRFVVPANSPTLGAVGDRIAHMLAKIGVRTRIERVPDDGFFKDHIASGDFDLALYSWPGSAYPVNDARPVYTKPVPAPDGSLTVQQNYARVGTDQIDRLLDAASSELDPAKAAALARRADARIWAAAGSIPLYQAPQLVAQRASVANAGAFGFATPRYQDIGFRK